MSSVVAMWLYPGCPTYPVPHLGPEWGPPGDPWGEARSPDSEDPLCRITPSPSFRGYAHCVVSPAPDSPGPCPQGALQNQKRTSSCVTTCLVAPRTSTPVTTQRPTLSRSPLPPSPSLDLGHHVPTTLCACVSVWVCGPRRGRVYARVCVSLCV